jgi:hypothetical protein
LALLMITFALSSQGISLLRTGALFGLTYHGRIRRSIYASMLLLPAGGILVLVWNILLDKVSVTPALPQTTGMVFAGSCSVCIGLLMLLIPGQLSRQLQSLSTLDRRSAEGIARFFGAWLIALGMVAFG